MFEQLKKWAKMLKQECYVLYLAYQNKKTPLLAKVLIVLTLSYALSPIDLIPDFIPIVCFI